MSLFDFFFPEQAQASHLRQIAEQNQRAAWQHTQGAAFTDARVRELEERVWKLENDLGFVALLCGSLLKSLEAKSQLSRQELLAVMHELDASDGWIDGKMDLNTLRSWGQKLNPESKSP